MFFTKNTVLIIMKTYVILPKIYQRELPKKFQENDNRFPENLVEFFLKNYTKKGNTVLDIFAGLGTTLFVSEELGRIPFGIEYDKERYEFITEKIHHKENIIHGDALELLTYKIPKCDFCFTSPPFMMKDEIENPFNAYTTIGSYQQYLEDIKKIFGNVKEVMKENAYIIVDVANLKNKEEGVTTLAWDIARKISEELRFVGETIIIWEKREKEIVDGQTESWRIAGTFGYGYDHSYCLIFKK
ncbi:MAG TPA: DNA methyltransferase [Candidatus Bathyarchaeia archaeon]|nr:DNA methyltransferase [Candidatus Bathyarchaeia archaeon]